MCGSVYEKKTQLDPEKKRAQECIDILFNPKKTEHYGSFIRCEHGTKTNFEHMTNFAIPLVILTWHRMIQEYFWKHEKKTFFQLGNYMPRKQRIPKDAIDLYMIDGNGTETHIKSFDMIHPNTDAGVSKDACLSLFEWAHYLLEPHAGIEKNNDSLDSDNDLKGPMISYEITDDEINWKKEIDTDTAGTNATASVTEEDKLWNQFDWNVESKNPATLQHNIAKALELSRSRYTKLKRMTKEQQDEKDAIELGMLSIMQMHYNDTGTEEAKNWKDTFTDIYSLHIKEYQKSIDSVMIDSEQENKEATQDNESDESGDDSDADDSDYVDPNERRGKFNIFEEEEESDGSGTKKTLGKDPAQEEMVAIETIVTNAIEKDATESGNEKGLDTNDKSETDEASNNKRTGDETLDKRKGKKAKKSDARKR